MSDDPGHSRSDSAHRHSAMQRSRTAFRPHVRQLVSESAHTVSPNSDRRPRDHRATNFQFSCRATAPLASSLYQEHSRSRAVMPRLARTLP